MSSNQGFAATDDLAIPQITTTTFPAFYRWLMGLRFPLKVADVLEIRDTINHAADAFRVPPPTPDYRHFKEALQTAIESFGIHNKRHVDRLIHILTMFRELHYKHSIHSRDCEWRLRSILGDNEDARRRSKQYGLLTLVASVFAFIAWIAMGNVGWLMKLSIVLLLYASLDYFHSLTTLRNEKQIVTRELNDLLRDRVDSLNWKTLIHKLALLMGYKHVNGLNVFLMHEHMDSGGYRHTYH